MSEFFSNLLGKILGFDMGAVVTVLLLFNAVIFTVQTFLVKLKEALLLYADQTKTQVDDKSAVLVGKAAEALAKVLAVFGKLLDIVAANRKH